MSGGVSDSVIGHRRCHDSVFNIWIVLNVAKRILADAVTDQRSKSQWVLLDSRLFTFQVVLSVPQNALDGAWVVTLIIAAIVIQDELLDTFDASRQVPVGFALEAFRQSSHGFIKKLHSILALILFDDKVHGGLLGGTLLGCRGRFLINGHQNVLGGFLSSLLQVQALSGIVRFGL